MAEEEADTGRGGPFVLFGAEHGVAAHELAALEHLAVLDGHRHEGDQGQELGNEHGIGVHERMLLLTAALHNGTMVWGRRPA